MNTQRYIEKVSNAKLIVWDNDNLRFFNLDTQSDWLIGRNYPGNKQVPDIPFDSMIVSRVHGWLKHIDNAWYYVENPDNLNGTFLNGTLLPKAASGTRKARIIKNGDVLRIDNKDLNHISQDGVLMLFTTQPMHGTWTSFSLNGHTSVTIGRHAGCDIVEPLPYISAKHAKITFVNGCYYLSDCGSKAGTFLNGKPLVRSELLREKDHISICNCNYFFLGNRLLYKKNGQAQEQKNPQQPLHREQPVILRADIETKRVKNNSGNGMKELIRDIHLEIRQGTLVALLGTAGAGKSTVMNCLNGMDLEGVQGSVVYRGVDLMKNFDQMKYLIGSVPQKKIFHKAFTPEQEFRLAARKRLPADMTDKEIEERVEKTLEMLSMVGVRNNRNSKLSGGEQTRVNVGIELVADRDLLCLDEPDQGLSPNYKHELFEIMRSLAHKNGKSVLSIIHDVSEIDLFDQVIMLAKVNGVGRLAFSGTPAEARAYFGVDIRDAYALLEREPERFVR